MLKWALIVISVMAAVLLLLTALPKHHHQSVLLSMALLLGTGLMGYALRSLRLARQTLHWQTVPARITNSNISETMKGEVQCWYAPDVVFEYQAPDGQKRESNKFGIIRGDFGSYERKDVAPLLVQHQVGSARQAYLNPTNFEQCVLKQGISAYQRSHLYALLVGGFLMNICFGLALWYALQN